jgi:hypothetical protein
LSEPLVCPKSVPFIMWNLVVVPFTVLLVRIPSGS